MYSRVAHSFAQAMTELAKEKKILADLKLATEDLLVILEIPDVIHFLEHPQVSGEAKKAALSELLLKKYPPELFNFLCVIVDRNQERFIKRIIELLLDMLIKAQGYEIIEIVSAQELSATEQTKIINDLEICWSTRLYPRYRTNSSLIGGMIIRRGDYLYDGSLTGQLQKLKQRLLT